MSPILVAGSGRMGRDIGLWLLRTGHRVCWISRQQSRLDALRLHVDRALRRWQREGGDATAAANATFATPDALASLANRPGILLEAVEEDIAAKQHVLAWGKIWDPCPPILLSTTSSFQPIALHPCCLVAHFFFPLELTGLVELVGQSGVTEKDQVYIHKLLHTSGIHVIEQTDRQAFAVNRLLLPAHAECVRAVGLGLAPALADRAAATGLLGVAPLALAESVGRRTIRAALANYAAATTHTDDYRQLILAVAAEAHEAPTGSGAAAGMDLAEACDIQQAVQLNTCLNFVQDGLIGVRDLDWLLTHYYGGTETLAAYLERCDRQALTARLQSLQRQTGRQYFVPAAALAGH